MSNRQYLKTRQNITFTRFTLAVLRIAQVHNSFQGEWGGGGGSEEVDRKISM